MFKIPQEKLDFIMEKIPNSNVQMHLAKKFGSDCESHREDIRQMLYDQFTSHFSRQQLANLFDLGSLPLASDGFFSISHSPKLGGFSYAGLKHGFDVEAIERISKPLILRTCSVDEVAGAPNPKLLWVAKEAALKAVSKEKDEFIITDFETENWQSHYEINVFSYRINSKKTLDLSLNKGFVFSEKDFLFAIFFK